MLFLRAPARDGFASFVLSCLSSRPVERTIRCMWIWLYACTYAWWYIMFCKKCYHSIHVYACRSEWICSKCTYVRVNDWTWIPFLYALRRIATSHSMLARRMYVCMHVFNWTWFWYWYHPTEWECLPSSLYVCTSKRAISIAVRLAALLEKALYIHTYIHACYTMLNAPHSNRRHESYRPCDCGSSSSSSSSMEKSWTATPEMIQSMKSAGWDLAAICSSPL